MATPVEMPKLGNTVEQCLLVKWTKKKGEKVSAGETIAEIETDKATFELAATADGVLIETFYSEGALVPVYTVVGVIGDPGESTEQYKSAAPEKAGQTTPSAPASATGGASAPTSPGPGSEGVFLSPRARRLAERRGYLPALGPGSGPGGRVLEEDLKAFYHAAPRISPLARKRMEAGFEAPREGTGINRSILARDLGEPPVRMSSIRERIARRMRESLSSTAQYTMHASADATGLLSLRAKIKAARETRALPDVNINDLVMFATARALAAMPELNAELIDGKLYRRAEIHLAFACDTDRGLLVPVVRNCGSLSVEELSRAVHKLAEQALAGAISVDDLTGATFTVSNLGNLGIRSFTPILNPPQVAILGVDALELRPVRRQGRVEFVDHIGLSLTCDHQVIDGAPGARFMKIVSEKIESIESISDLVL
jgi:pyruvate dehydrogenase E2 component (dihydrolipoamide acetyltransferase)